VNAGANIRLYLEVANNTDTKNNIFELFFYWCNIIYISRKIRLHTWK
jgi:hypothetical protein